MNQGLKRHTLIRWMAACLILFAGILFFLSNSSNASAAGLPNASEAEPAYDQVNILSADTKKFVQHVNKQYSKTTEQPQIVIAAVQTLGDETKESYAEKLFQSWKLGKKGEDNGVLILFASQERQIWIEIGYGLEGRLTDSKTGRILDDNLDLLKADNFDEALRNIFTSIAIQVNKEYDFSDDEIFSGYDIDTSDYEDSEDSSFLKNLFMFFFIIMIIFSIIGSGSGGGRGGRGRRRNSSWYSGGGFGGFGGGGFGGGSSGGGGFSGGGGSSGGGGAGRSF